RLVAVSSISLAEIGLGASRQRAWHGAKCPGIGLQSSRAALERATSEKKHRIARARGARKRTERVIPPLQRKPSAPSPICDLTSRLVARLRLRADTRRLTTSTVGHRTIVGRPGQSCLRRDGAIDSFCTWNRWKTALYSPFRQSPPRPAVRSETGRLPWHR